MRRIGLMLAVEFSSPEIVRNVVQNCFDRGVITFWFLSTTNSIRLAPPLIIDDEQIKTAAGKILEAIDAI